MIALALVILPLAWQPVFAKDGVTVERRTLPGSPYPELRIRASCPRPPASVFKVVWGTREYFEFSPNLKHLEVLREEGDVRVIYAQLTLPVVRNRDYVLWNKKHLDAANELYEIEFKTVLDERKPEDAKHVRVKSIRGSWTIEPSDDGRGSDITYVVHTDPGGSIPAWAANVAQERTAPDFVRSIVQRAVEKY